MPWGRIDDTYYDHPKLEAIGGEGTWPDRLAAAGLNALAWSWCNRFLTDGHVPRRTVEKLGGTHDLAEMLVGAGLWEHAASGYQIHDFLVYNDSRADVTERREKEAKRKAAWRAEKLSQRDNQRDTPKRRKARPSGTDSGTANGAGADVPPSVPAGQGDDMEAVSRRPSQRLSRDSRARTGGIRESRPVPSRPSDSPKPRGAGPSGNPRANGTNPRAMGTSPRQVAKREQAEADEARRTKGWRKQRRDLAYYRGEITEAQLTDMNRRDAPLSELPSPEAEAPSWLQRPGASA